MHVRELTGLRCDALVAREFWLGDRRVTCACYVFLSLSDGEALGWWLDDDEWVWRVEPVDVIALPGADDGWVDEDGTAWRYPHVDLASRFGIRGQALSRWESGSGETATEARLVLADGTSVVFAYEFRLETYRVARKDGPGRA